MHACVRVCDMCVRASVRVCVCLSVCLCIRMCIYVVGGVKRFLVTQQKAGVDMTNKWTGVEHALAAINKACCSNKPNIAMLHANDGMALLIRLLDRAAGA